MSFRAVNPGSCGLLFPMLNMQSLRAFLIALLLLFSLGCGPAPKQGVSRAARPASVRTAPAVGGVPVGQQKLMLFGGPGHRDYLGCISCSEYATDSVFNQYGTYGSRYSGTSIWNHYGDYGSAYSTRGACNPYATDPPVIVDGDGNFHGRLTLNKYHQQIGLGTAYHDWLDCAVCEN